MDVFSLTHKVGHEVELIFVLMLRLLNDKHTVRLMIKAVPLSIFLKVIIESNNFKSSSGIFTLGSYSLISSIFPCCEEASVWDPMYLLNAADVFEKDKKLLGKLGAVFTLKYFS